MTLDQLKGFLAKVRSDARLFERVKAAESADEITLIAAENGHVFTSMHINELTDGELESVSGGANICTGCQIATTCIDDSQILQYTNSG
ncbi:Nitrogen fixation protein of unknown function [Synechococcus sp. MIT S9509]|uniref:Nif11-like leader peptide family RiPP precursor n=1 Tax=unclassified Synechococcus TaxID=2626047 RepID=UPI0007BB1358|nr:MULTISPECIES: Nif11-like leader peptide family RiPP precursor [unclassified Synechococcus]KZR87681.1 Nitrogen fixation protein of unknown function [Synechococcus sp. MIT S9504]KZR93190.1 Nitrogen fixation protein of unknown function [Synechococcus sp. MIT S9509]